MKFNFKIQQYQTDAIDAVVKAFNGQGFYDKISYIRDLGKMKSKDMQMTLGFTDEEMQLYDPANDIGYKNELVELSDEQLLNNIQALQRQNNIKLSNSLVKDLGRCSLDIEMETGTGKTYVYIKTMFELNKKYGSNHSKVTEGSASHRFNMCIRASVFIIPGTQGIHADKCLETVPGKPVFKYLIASACFQLRGIILNLIESQRKPPGHLQAHPLASYCATSCSSSSLMYSIFAPRSFQALIYSRPFLRASVLFFAVHFISPLPPSRS